MTLIDKKLPDQQGEDRRGEENLKNAQRETESQKMHRTFKERSCIEGSLSRNTEKRERSDRKKVYLNMTQERRACLLTAEDIPPTKAEDG